MIRPPWLLLGPAMGCLLWSRALHASAPAAGSPTAGFEWIAPPGCPSRAEVAARAAEILGPDRARPLAGRAEVRASGDGFALVVIVGAGSSQRRRELTAASCPLAADAAALLLAMSASEPHARGGSSPPSITTTLSSSLAPPAARAAASASNAPDAALASTAPQSTSPSSPEHGAAIEEAAPPPTAPTAATTLADAEPRPTQTRLAAPESEPPPRLPETSASPRAMRLARFTAGVMGGVVTGALPSTSASIGGAVSVHPFPRLRFELEGAYAPSQTSTLPSGAGGSLWLVTGSARGCLPIGDARLEGALCAGVAFTDVHGTGRGVSIVRQADAQWWAPEVGLSARWRLSGWAGLRAGAVASFPLTRQRFVIDDAGVVDQPDFVSIRATVGPEVLF